MLHITHASFPQFTIILLVVTWWQ